MWNHNSTQMTGNSPFLGDDFHNSLFAYSLWNAAGPCFECASLLASFNQDMSTRPTLYGTREDSIYLATGFFTLTGAASFFLGRWGEPEQTFLCITIPQAKWFTNSTSTTDLDDRLPFLWMWTWFWSDPRHINVPWFQYLFSKGCILQWQWRKWQWHFYIIMNECHFFVAVAKVLSC
jgi:hypothetical protein